MLRHACNHQQNKDCSCMWNGSKGIQLFLSNICLLPGYASGPGSVHTQGLWDPLGVCACLCVCVMAIPSFNRSTVLKLPPSGEIAAFSWKGVRRDWPKWQEMTRQMCGHWYSTGTRKSSSLNRRRAFFFFLSLITKNIKLGQDKSKINVKCFIGVLLGFSFFSAPIFGSISYDNIWLTKVIAENKSKGTTSTSSQSQVSTTHDDD